MGAASPQLLISDMKVHAGAWWINCNRRTATAGFDKPWIGTKTDCGGCELPHLLNTVRAARQHETMEMDAANPLTTLSKPGGDHSNNNGST